VKAEVTDQDSTIATSTNNRWQVLQKYYSLVDGNYEVYANVTLLNPTLRLQDFRDHWDGNMEGYLTVMRDACWTHWKEDYLVAKPLRVAQPGKQSILDGFLTRSHTQSGDEFEIYCKQVSTVVDTKSFSPI
jgi:hypothetical protein